MLWKKIQFLIIFGHLSRKCAGILKLTCTCPEKFFENKTCWENGCSIHHFGTLSEKFFAICRNISAGLSNLHSTCPQEQFEERSFFVIKLNFSYHFRTLSKKPFVWKFSPVLSKLISKCSQEHFEKMLLLCWKIRTFFIVCGHWAKHFWVLSKNF